MKKTKKCSMCGKRKPVAQFSKDRRASDGLYSCCKPCHLGKTRRYYKENREAVLERQRKYERDFPEKRRAARKKWADKNPDNLAERKKRYRAKHKEKLSADYKRWYERNRAEKLEYMDRYREANREEIYARRDWTKHKEYGRMRRARVAGAHAEFVDYDEIILRDQGRCGICGKVVLGDLEFDHIHPIAAGGTHEPDNVQVAHSTCNRRKHARIDFSLIDAA